MYKCNGLNSMHVVGDVLYCSSIRNGILHISVDV